MHFSGDVVSYWLLLAGFNLSSCWASSQPSDQQPETSTAGQRGEAFHSAYAASKGAAISFVKSLATELGPSGIRVNAVAPGWVRTDMSNAAIAADEARIRESIPLRRIPDADDIAGPILFLLSPLARHVTGEVLNVNGGSVLAG